MVDVKNEFRPDYAVPPGEILEYEIQIRSMSQKELSDRTGITAKHIISIMKGDSPITPPTAIKLERVLGILSGLLAKSRIKFPGNSRAAGGAGAIGQRFSVAEACPCCGNGKAWLDRSIKRQKNCT